ncbi:hypothetical protein GY45DRAFT_272232 [Cubamyces sp. BRFM 1775]|nr:hypothetical protein GY45DRAFT_272232 [Cubamyces sp. BRFM 1775]
MDRGKNETHEAIDHLSQDQEAFDCGESIWHRDRPARDSCPIEKGEMRGARLRSRMTRLAISRPPLRARLLGLTEESGCWCFWIVGRCAASGDDHDAARGREERDQDVVSGWARVGHEALKQEGENNKRIGSIATLAMATVTEIGITAERQNDLSECTRPFQKVVLRALSLAHPLPSRRLLVVGRICCEGVHHRPSPPLAL